MPDLRQAPLPLASATQPGHASLPPELDLFRVGNFATVIIGTERFMEAVHRLELDGITFREVPTR